MNAKLPLSVNDRVQRLSRFHGRTYGFGTVVAVKEGRDFNLLSILWDDADEIVEGFLSNELVRASINDKFAELDQLEQDYRGAYAVRGFGVDAATRSRAAQECKKISDKAYAIRIGFSVEEGRQYVAYKTGLALKACTGASEVVSDVH